LIWKAAGNGFWANPRREKTGNDDAEQKLEALSKLQLLEAKLRLASYPEFIKTVLPRAAY
jgi:hypothetical protein